MKTHRPDQNEQSWPEFRLGDVTTLVTDSCVPSSAPETLFQYHSIPAWDENGGPTLSAGSEIGSNKFVLSRPCALVSKLNPRKPRVSVVSEIPVGIPHCASTEFMVFAPKTDQLAVLFLGRYLASNDFQQRLEQIATGTTNSHVRARPTETLNWLIPVPPLLEQRRIVEILDTVDAAIRQTEAVIAKLKQVKAGLLHDLLTRGIDENGELRDSDIKPPTLDDSFAFPSSWPLRKLGYVASINSGLTLGPSTPRGPSSVELPYLRVANVQDGFVDLSEVKFVRVLRSAIERYRLQYGDVLMNEGGDFDKLGRGTVWRNQIDPCLHQNHVFRVRVDPSIMRPDFLAAVSGSAYGKRFFVLSSKQSTNLASINSTQLKSFPVPCPSLEEQDRIVQAIQYQDARIESESTYLNILRAVGHGLAGDLLTGQFRVPLSELVMP